MSLRSHEGPQSVKGNEGESSLRLADLQRLKVSPVLPLVSEAVQELISKGNNVQVGISTEESVRLGSTPAVCVVAGVTRHGEFGNKFHPERYDFRIARLLAQGSGLDKLSVTVRGATSIHRDPSMPHAEDDIANIRESLNNALLHPSIESTSIGADLTFPVRGFESLSL